ncbi:MAG: bifunctional 5,10-methylenetetrahydrofolate dehydrogenase/5,10-methenyltetrahydrofolate cyclohydrolase, partial [Acidobacteriaceae bacterium]
MPEARILDGKRMAAEIREEVRREAAHFFDATGIRPRIVFLLVGNNPASEVYVRNKGIAAEEAGFSHETKGVPAEIEEYALLDMIRSVNEDPATHGLLVQFPLPQHIREERVIELLAPEKDVDGFHPVNVGRLAIGMTDYFAPCTPLGVMEMLARENVEVFGKHVVIVGRSNLVGKPLSLLLSQKAPHANAIVTLAHSAAGSGLGALTREADILIAAMGTPRAITAEMVREG